MSAQTCIGAAGCSAPFGKACLEAAMSASTCHRIGTAVTERMEAGLEEAEQQSFKGAVVAWGRAGPPKSSFMPMACRQKCCMPCSRAWPLAKTSLSLLTIFARASKWHSCCRCCPIYRAGRTDCGQSAEQAQPITSNSTK